MNRITAVIAAVLVIAGCGTSPNTSQKPVKKVATVDRVGPCAYTVSYPNQMQKKRVVVSKNPVRYKDYECMNGKIVDRNVPCPGLANPWCSANWAALDVGMPEDDVKVLLGSPDSVRPWPRSSEWNYLGNFGGVTIADGKVSGFKKPAARHYMYFQPIKSSAVNTPVANLVSSCPGLGDPGCKVNWDFVKQGTPKAQLEMLLGSPDSIKNIKVGSGSIQFDETWIFKPDAEIRLFDGLVVGYDRPGSYTYLGGVKETKAKKL